MTRPHIALLMGILLLAGGVSLATAGDRSADREGDIWEDEIQASRGPRWHRWFSDETVERILKGIRQRDPEKAKAIVRAAAEAGASAWLRLTQRRGRRAVQVTSFVGVIRAPDGYHADAAACGGVAVAAEERISRNTETLAMHLVADTVAGTGKIHAQLRGDALKISMIVNVRIFLPLAMLRKS